MQQEIIDAVKNIFANMQAIGWAPWPVVIACAATVIVRLALEDDVLQVNDIAAKRRYGRIKALSFLVGYVVSVIACFGFDAPKNPQDRIQAFMFSILNAGVGYLAWSAWTIIDPIGRFKDKFGKREADNAAVKP